MTNRPIRDPCSKVFVWHFEHPIPVAGNVMCAAGGPVPARASGVAFGKSHAASRKYSAWEQQVCWLKLYILVESKTQMVIPATGYASCSSLGQIFLGFPQNPSRGRVAFLPIFPFLGVSASWRFSFILARPLKSFPR